jgi:flagellar protein FliO/FliZ
MQASNSSHPSYLNKQRCGMVWLMTNMPSALAADLNKTTSTLISTPSPTAGILQVILGLLTVLAVMALVAWLVKRIGAGINNNPAVARIVGGVSVGSRERVVVIEIANRWIVVGVAPGQVNSLANLEIGTAIQPGQETSSEKSAPTLPPFAKWLKQAINKSGKN